MEQITGLLEDFDFTKYLPKIGKILSSVRFWTVLFLYAAPLIMLGMGLRHYLRPVPEANNKRGYRIYYGMGSTEAWLFTQKLAGLVWTVLGAVLTVISIIISLVHMDSDTMRMLTACVMWVGIEAILALIAYGVIYLLVFLRYDKDGNLKD